MPSKREKFYGSCVRKKRLTEEEAQHVIKNITKGVLYKYYCKYCFGWHLTKRKQ